MARPLKTGLDYFPFDVDFFEDDKMMLIESEFGMKGGYIAVRLLCKIYKEGYYYKWGVDECLLFTRSLGAESVSKGLVDEVILCMVKRGFFNSDLFDRYHILTSNGIQKRYFEATKRYKNIEVFNEYLLIDLTNAKNVDINSINVSSNATKEKKGKESKVNESNTKTFTLSDGDQKCINSELFEVMEVLLHDQIWIEPICMNNKTSLIQMQDYIKTFFGELQSREDIDKPIKDCKDHFAKWLVIQLNKPNYSGNYGKENVQQQSTIGAGINFR